MVLNPKLAYRPDIDGIRAIAVILVIIFHAFPKYLPGGFIGVDIFFVISGYLISGIIYLDLKNNCFTFRNFYKRRVLRIFPALIVVLLAALVSGYFFLLPDEYAQLGKHITIGSIFGENFLLWHETGYFDVNANTKPLLNLWSLAIEEQFYLVFPAVMLILYKRYYRLSFIIFLLTCFSFWDNIYLHRLDPTADFYSPLTRFWELFAGACLQLSSSHHMYKKIFNKVNDTFSRLIYTNINKQNGASFFLTILGFTLIFLALIYTRPGNAYPGYKAIFPIAGTLCLLCSQRNFINYLILENKISIFIGKISYPLYLWHWPILSFYYIIYGGSASRSILTSIILLLLIFIISTLTYIFIEKPIRYKHIWGRYTVPLLLFFMIITACSGYYVWKENGLASRSSIKASLSLVNGIKLSIKKDSESLRYNSLNSAPYEFFRYKDNGSSETIAVFGDSHAHAAYPGLEHLAEQNGYNIALFGSSGLLVRSTENYTHINPLLNLIKNKKDIKKVFIFLRGTLYFWEPDNNHKINLKTRKNNPEYIEEYHNDLQNIINELHDAGKEVFLVEEVPETVSHIQSIIKRGFSGFTIKKNYQPTLSSEVEAHRKEYNEILKNLKNVHIIKTFDNFCPGKECKMFSDDGLPLYYDTTHLSINGSMWLANKILKPYIKKKIE